MNKFFKVLSSLKHDGVLHEAGKIIEGSIEQFGELAKAGILKVIEGAKSLEHATSIVASEKVTPPPVTVVKPNTWEAKKDEVKPETKEDEKPAETSNASELPKEVKPAEEVKADVAPVEGDNL